MSLLAATALTGTACSTGTDQTAPPPAVTNVSQITELDLRNTMRGAFVDHASLTRLFVLESIANLNDTSRTLERLFDVQTNVGDTVAPFWGARTGEELANLLHTQTTLTSDVITARRSIDRAAYAAAVARLYANGDRIAALLADQAPDYPADMHALVRVQLDRLVDAISARMEGDFAKANASYDAMTPHLLAMGDAIAGGIATNLTTLQPSKLDPKQQALELALNEVFAERTIANRVHVVSVIGRLPDVDALNRVMQNTVDVGHAIQPYYGSAVSGQLTLLLAQYTLIGNDFLVASRTGDAAKAATAEKQWYAKADEIGAFFASLDPTLSGADLRAAWRDDVDHQRNQITARMAGDWTNDLAAFDEGGVRDQAMANTIAGSIERTFPTKVVF